MVEHYRARDLLSYYRCNRRIHESIVRAADNAVLAGLYESISARIRRARFITPMSPEHWALAVQEHDGMLNALQRRDANGLAHILRTHLRRKREEVVQAGFAEPAVRKARLPISGISRRPDCCLHSGIGRFYLPGGDRRWSRAAQMEREWWQFDYG